MSRHDVVVIGGGTGGLTAAREANRRGAWTVLISDGPLGGDCTHTGCVPSKALLDAAARGQSFAEAMATVHQRIEEVAATEDADTLVREGIAVLSGRPGSPAAAASTWTAGGSRDATSSLPQAPAPRCRPSPGCGSSRT